MVKDYVVSGKKISSLKLVYRRILLGNILGWVVYVLGSFADSIFGGLFLGEDALAAIEIITPLATLIYFLSYLVSTGSSLLHAKYIGKNDFEGASRIYSTGFYFSIVIGIISAIAMILVKESWLDFYELEGTIREHASDYYDPFIIIALITPLGTQIYDCIVCDGDHVYTVISDVALCVTNIVLSLILVGSMGTKGLSIATLVATAVGYIIPMFRLFSKANTLHLSLKFSFKDMFNSMKIGSSSFLTVLAIAIIDIIMNLYISKVYDPSYTAPYAIVNFALEIASALALVGQTMTTLMNFSIGEENYKDCKDLLAYSKKVAFLVGLGFTVGFIAGTPLWPELFGLETEEFINITYVASITIGLSFIPQTFFYLICSFYTSFEKMKVSVFSEIMNSLIYPLLFPILLSTLFGYYGFVIGFAVSNVASFVTLSLVLYLKNKKVVYRLPDVESNMYSIDLILDKESISKSIVTIRDILSENNVDPSLSNKVQLSLEESLIITLNQNNPKKIIYSRIVIDINSSRIKLIVKDTGKIFNVINKDQNLDGLENYVYVMSVSTASKAVNYVATNLNGNHYEFSL